MTLTSAERDAIWRAALRQLLAPVVKPVSLLKD